MLDLTQVFAWMRMFAGHVRTESIITAAKETFDPNKPCSICRAVSKAREAANQHGPAVPSAGFEKITLILNGSACIVPASAKRSWPEPFPTRAVVRIGDVPVPPPKAVFA
jgi:hypothetical protein